MIDGPTIVAVTVIVVFGTIALVVAVKRPVRDFLQIWNVLGPIFGLALGGIATHFFTAPKIEQEKQKVTSARTEAAIAQTSLASLQMEHQKTKASLASLQMARQETAAALINAAKKSPGLAEYVPADLRVRSVGPATLWPSAATGPATRP